MADWGIDILGHLGRQVKPSMLQEAWLVLAMEQFHVDILREMAPEHHHKVRLLSSFATAPIMRDIPDPYGHVKFFYRTSALIIHGCIEQVAVLLRQKFPDLCKFQGGKLDR
jgi:protein-tyrosine-phosphatase